MQVGMTLGAAVIGGATVWLAQGHSLKILPEDISYADLIAVLLTAVSLIVGIFGVVMAILAIWGYSHFKLVVTEASDKTAREVAEQIAKEHVSQDLADGKTRQFISQLVEEHMRNLEDPRYIAWREQRSKEAQLLNELDEDERPGGE